MEQIRTLIAAQDGIREIVANPKTGSILVHYDPEKITRETLTMAVGMLENELKKSPAAEPGCIPRLFTGKNRRRHEAALLSAVYGLTVLGGFLDKRVHIASGVLFTALAAMHLYDRRKCL